MPVRRLLAAAATALLGWAVLATPAAADASAASAAVDAYTLTTGRLVGTGAALVALAGVVIGVRALARSGRLGNPNGNRGALVALVAGLAGMVTGGLVVAAAEGGPGTGYGIVGGFAALAVGLIAALLGGLALLRTRRIATRRP